MSTRTTVVSVALVLLAASGLVADPFDGPWVSSQLTHETWGEQDPMFSPDGSTIAYTARLGGLTDIMNIYLVNSDGSEPRQVGTRAACATPSFTRNGSILFSSANLPEDGDIWKMDANGNNERVLQRITGTGEYMPNELPDGRILYGSYYPMSIWVANADMTSPQRLTAATHDDRSQPRVSPDGQYVVYHSQASSGTPYDLYRYDMQTGIETQLTSDSAEQGWGAFSPDGNWIVYQSKEDNGPDFDIWVMDKTGHNRHQLTFDSQDHMFPQFDPRYLDGSRIVFSRGTWGERMSTDLWQLNAVPEPLSMAFMASAFVGMVGYRLRRRSRGTGQG